MSDYSPQGGCSKHGPFEVCGHTEATCLSIMKALAWRRVLGKGFRVENESDDGSPNKDEWVEFHTRSAEGLADDLSEGIRYKLMDEGFSTVVTSVRRYSRSVVSKTLGGAFKNGLKSEEEINSEKPMYFRFVDTPPIVLKEDRLIFAMSYELSVYLKPRYTKDGDAGYYNFLFTIKVKKLSDKDINNRHITNRNRDKNVYVTTIADQKVKMKVQEQIQGAIQISRDNWEETTRSGLARTLTGGLPGLGKRK